MRTLARKPAADPQLPATAATIAGGGVVGAIQRSIVDRMAEGGAFEIAVASAPEDSVQRAVALLSRCAGPLALGGGYFVAARLLWS
jgi:hypothetical protein